MASKETKNCFIRTCSNNTRLTPHKKLFCVPAGQNEAWCRAAGLDRVPKRIFICEDHLDLEKDMGNYRYWKVMNVNAKLKPRLPASLTRRPLKEANQAAPSTSHDEPTPSSAS